jgi:hypothetical protein
MLSFELKTKIIIDIDVVAKPGNSLGWAIWENRTGIIAINTSLSRLSTSLLSSNEEA